MPRYTIEFYEDEHGDSPVLRRLREDLTPTQRRAIGVAMSEILQEEGIGVCRTGYGKQLGDGLFEFRLRHDAAEILRSVGKTAGLSPAANESSCECSAMPMATASCCFSAATTKAPTQARSASSARSPTRANASRTSVGERGE